MTAIDPKKRIRQTLHSLHSSVNFRIRYKEPDREFMNKQIFIKILNDLKKIEDRRDFMVEEIGMDMTAYEDLFFNVVENCFKMVFSKEQLALVQMYLYQLVPDKGWDGTITVEKGKEEVVVNFKTPSDVWDVIKDYK